MSTTSTSLKSILPLLLALFIDFFGFVGLICYLPILFSDMEFSLFNSYPTQYRYFLFGLFLTTFSLFQCIGNLVFSRLINYENSRSFLILSYLGNCSGYIICAMALITKTPYLLYVGNAIAGFLGTTLTGTQTSIANISHQKEQFKGFNWSSLCIGAAFLSAPPLFSKTIPALHNGYIAPWAIFACCAVFSLISSVIVGRFVPKSDIRFKMRSDPLEKPSRFTARDKWHYLAVFLFGCGWSIFIKFFQFYLIQNHNITESASCHLMMFFGLGVLITQVLLALTPFTPPLGRSFNIAILLCGFFIFTINFMHGYLPIVLNLVLLSMAYAYTQSSMPLVTIHTLDKTTPGKAMALYQSALALGKVLAPLLGGGLIFYFNEVPFALSCLLIISSLGIFLKVLQTSSLDWEPVKETNN